MTELTLEEIRGHFESKRLQWVHATKTLRGERSRLKRQRRGLERVYEGQRLIQVIAQGVQQQAHEQITKVVSDCLKAVFSHPIRFRIEFERKRGKTEAKLLFQEKVKGKWIDRNPTDETGIGQVDVAAFALRLACLLLQKPHKRRLLIVDEPFKNVNGEGNRERVAELLETLAEEFEVQIILTTGYQWLKVGEVVELA